MWKVNTDQRKEWGTNTHKIIDELEIIQFNGVCGIIFNFIRITAGSYKKQITVFYFFLRILEFETQPAVAGGDNTKCEVELWDCSGDFK